MGMDWAVQSKSSMPHRLEKTGAPGLAFLDRFFRFEEWPPLSSDQSAEELFPALARNIMTSGYRASAGADSMVQTEYLKLILQYLSQARELEQLAGEAATIRIPQCESAETAQILKILGFRLRNECGPEAVLETVNPSRAFLSIDSGFPLADLEQAFRTEKPFELPYKATHLPVLFGKEYWTGIAQRKAEGRLHRHTAAEPGHGAALRCFGQDAPVRRLWLCERRSTASGCLTSPTCLTFSAATLS